MCPEALVISGDFNLSLATRNTFRPDPFIRSYLRFLLLLVPQIILFLLPLNLLFPSPIILLFSVLLVSHDQLCHAKNWLFVNSKILILLRSQLILPLLCFVQAYTGTTMMHSPIALTRPLLTYWISLPRLKQGLWLIFQRFHGLMMTSNNSNVNVVALKRKPWKLTSLVTGIITIKFVMSALHYLNLHVWIIFQT